MGSGGDSMRCTITHVTTYDYAESVAMSHNLAHLMPRNTPRQTVLASKLDISPAPAVVATVLDYYGNHTSFFTVQEPHQRLIVRLESEVIVTDAPPPVAALTQRWEIARAMGRSDLSPAGLEVMEFAWPSPLAPAPKEAEEYALASFTKGRPLLEAALDLNHRINQDFLYMPLVTTISTPITEVLKMRQGVCQDFAHLMIGCIRSMGLAARYVSGYLVNNPVEGFSPTLVGADASHAWVSVFIPGIGWLDFDPTNDTITGEEHITLAWGRDYADVSPLRGIVLGGGMQTLAVKVEVVPAATP